MTRCVVYTNVLDPHRHDRRPWSHAPLGALCEGSPGQRTRRLCFRGREALHRRERVPFLFFQTGRFGCCVAGCPPATLARARADEPSPRALFSSSLIASVMRR